MRGGFLWLDHAVADEFAYERMVFSDLLDLEAANEVQAAVTDVPLEQFVAANYCSGADRAHALEIGMRSNVLADGSAGCLETV